MYKSSPLIFFSIFFFIHSINCFSQSKNERLTQALQKVFDENRLPGMSVVMVNAQGIVYNQGFGYANIEDKTNFTARSIQNIGSVSKTFLSIALMKAIELGYFNLDTDINSLLPFKVVNPHSPSGIITVRYLTNHTSGILDHPAIYPNVYHFDTALSNYDSIAYQKLKDLGYQQKVERLQPGVFLQEYLTPEGKYFSKENFTASAPGTSASYSNIGSALAAYLIELKSGLTYADFTSRYILKPLKMNHSNWVLRKRDLKSYAKPYLSSDAALPFYDFITYPEGGLRTNTKDLSKYLMELIHAYGGTSILLNASSVATMFSPQFTKDNVPTGMSLTHRNKGVLWNLYVDGTIGHDGDDPGVSSFLFFNPATGIGGVFLCNEYIVDKSRIINLMLRYASEK